MFFAWIIKLSLQPLMGFKSLRGSEAYYKGELSKARTSIRWGWIAFSKQPIRRNFTPLVHCYSNRTFTGMALSRVREAPRYCLMAVKLDPTIYGAHKMQNDTALIRKAAQMLLDYHGFKTKVVENGQEAVDMFIAGNSFDVVFMDMEMPVMDGIQATKELRAMGVKSLIYGITASESKTEIQAFVEAGLDEYFQKPLNTVMIDSLMKRLNL